MLTLQLLLNTTDSSKHNLGFCVSTTRKDWIALFNICPVLDNCGRLQILTEFTQKILPLVTLSETEHPIEDAFENIYKYPRLNTGNRLEESNPINL